MSGEKSEPSSNGFNVELIKNSLGYASLLYLASMFLPWMTGFASINGWTFADAGSNLSAAAILVYLVPIGAALVLYHLGTNNEIPGFVRFTGLVPLLLLMGALYKVYDTTGGNLDLGYFFEKVLFKQMGIGFWLALVVGIFVFLKAGKNPNLT